MFRTFALDVPGVSRGQPTRGSDRETGRYKGKGVVRRVWSKGILVEDESVSVLRTRVFEDHLGPHRFVNRLGGGPLGNSGNRTNSDGQARTC